MPSRNPAFGAKTRLSHRPGFVSGRLGGAPDRKSSISSKRRKPPRRDRPFQDEKLNRRLRLRSFRQISRFASGGTALSRQLEVLPVAQLLHRAKSRCRRLLLRRPKPSSGSSAAHWPIAPPTGLPRARKCTSAKNPGCAGGATAVPAKPRVSPVVEARFRSKRVSPPWRRINSGKNRRRAEGVSGDRHRSAVVRSPF